MYGLSNVESNRTPFPLSNGVTNVELKSCSYVDGGSWEAIDFVYGRTTDDGESTLKDRMFAVNEANISPSSFIENDTKEAAVDREAKRLNTRLKHIATKFSISPNTLLSVTGKDFREYAEAYCKIVNSHCKGVKLYCKTVKDASGYVKIAKYPNFLQRMDSGECELKYTERELAANVSNSPTNGAVKETRNVDSADSWTK